MSGTTVIVAHNDPETLEELRLDLADRGYHVLGPTRRAGVALALASQTPAAFAIVGEELAGRRDGHALAAALERIWGVPSIILAENDAESPDAPGAA